MLVKNSLPHTLSLNTNRTNRKIDEALAINRQKLRNKLRKMNDSEKMMPIKTEIVRITDEMAVYRKQMKLCEDIALRSGAIEAVVNKIYESEIQMEKPIERKEQEHEYKRRSR